MTLPSSAGRTHTDRLWLFLSRRLLSARCYFVNAAYFIQMYKIHDYSEAGYQLLFGAHKMKLLYTTIWNLPSHCSQLSTTPWKLETGGTAPWILKLGTWRVIQLHGCGRLSLAKRVPGPYLTRGLSALQSMSRRFGEYANPLLLPSIWP
jgi:hypothetical protein